MAGDPYWANVSLLLHGDGADAGSVFVDSSRLNHAITTSGAPQTKTTDAKYGTAGIRFDANEYLEIGAAADFSFLHQSGTRWTWEGWVKAADFAANKTLFSTCTTFQTNHGVWCALLSDRRLLINIYRGASSDYGYSIFSNASAFPNDTDYHHVVVELDDTLASDQIKFFVDGVPVGTGSRSNPLSSVTATSPLKIGGFASTGDFRGALDEIRITKDVARYTAAFTPPTEAFDDWLPPSEPDPHYGSVSLLLHGDGTDGSTAFSDSGPLAKSVTAVGNAKISTTQSKYGGASAYFDGTGDYLQVANFAGVEFGSGDFTVESWFYTQDTGLDQAIATCYKSADPSAGWVFRYSPTSSPAGLRFVALNASGVSDIFQFAWAPAANTWYYLAAVRSGNTITLYVNGVSVGSGSLVNSTTIANSGQPLCIGMQLFGGTPTLPLKGYLDDLRITKGVARYTADFAPPTEPFADTAPAADADADFANVSLLLHGEGANNSTEVVDSSLAARVPTLTGNAKISSAQRRFGNTSLYFDGASSAVQFAADAAFNFGTGDFTAECFVFFSDAPGTRQIIAGNSASTGTNDTVGIAIDRRTDGKISAFGCSGASVVGECIGTTVTAAGRWYHIAYVRQGTTFRLFVNGVLERTVSSVSAGLNASVNKFSVGALGEFSSSLFLKGYIDEFRITKGLARYTATFTPPLQAFPEGVAHTATGLNAAPQFGTPLAIFDQFAQAVGLSAAPSFGVPIGALINRFVQATGLNATPSFGLPVGALEDRIVQATGLSATPSFGLPKAIPQQFGQATGLNAAPSFGVPQANGPRTVQATGLNAAPSFGAATSMFDQLAKASGFTAGAIGSPSAGRVCQATGLGPMVLFGTPYLTEPRAVQASGFSPTRFGRQSIAIRTTAPRATARHVHAYALRPTVRFGTPTAIG